LFNNANLQKNTASKKILAALRGFLARKKHIPNIQFRGVVKQKKLNKRKDYLADLNAMKAAVAARFAKPVLYDYTVDVTLEIKTAKGVERVAVTGEDTRYEFNWLNQ
jgi:hypothetical protein